MTRERVGAARDGLARLGGGAGGGASRRPRPRSPGRDRPARTWPDGEDRPAPRVRPVRGAELNPAALLFAVEPTGVVGPRPWAAWASAPLFPAPLRPDILRVGSASSASSSRAPFL